MVATRPGWITINLTDVSGQQLINVYRPFGAQLPSIGHLEDVRHTLDTGEPAISNLFTGLVLKVPTVGFTVPVRRRGTLKYALGARLDVGTLSLLLSEGQLPPDWVAMIFDRQGTILARTRGIEQCLYVYTLETWERKAAALEAADLDPAVRRRVIRALQEFH